MESIFFDSGFGYGGYGGYGSYGAGLLIGALIPILIVAGGLALYFLFAARKTSPSENPAAKWLYNALSFRTLFTERLLRAIYCITVVSITVISVLLLFGSFISAVLFFLFVNLIARVIFELLMLTLILCRNVQEINDKTSPKVAQPPMAPRPQQAPVRPVAPQQAPVQPAAPQQAPMQPTAPPIYVQPVQPTAPPIPVQPVQPTAPQQVPVQPAAPQQVPVQPAAPPIPSVQPAAPEQTPKDHE